MGLWGIPLLLVVVAILTVAALGATWLARRPSGDARRTGLMDHDPARDRLRERYARGEIDDEEYERRLAGLTWK
jgi:putative membrane protein